MNSFISSSDAGRWRRFTGAFLATAAIVLCGIVVFAYAVDPYDSGRSSLFAKAGVRPQGPRTAAPSRGRDLSYNAAIVGNSHIQLLSPEHLKETTGLDFVQLSVPASGPKEQFVIIDWFLRHRQNPAKALVISADESWCGQDPAMPNTKPFPFWLFSANPLEYAKGLVRYDILEEVPRRLGYVFNAKAERARPDGYWNYEQNYIDLGYANDPVLRQRLETRPDADKTILPSDPMKGKWSFPVADKLKQVVSAMPADLAVVLVFPPNYKNYLPPPQTSRAYKDEACKVALRAAMEAHPKSTVIDWRVDREENRDPNLYFDLTHYRLPIARKVETDVAAALRKLR
ncbi:hypothetical protein [Microvirga flavescens]|uniref:hypothetical protein n=1 Tax=Microvirga flavescens TaxID=2249811 RepID=UPI000DD9E956|nr:hypothetical protein [Microvirga flavescens]